MKHSDQISEAMVEASQGLGILTGREATTEELIRLKIRGYEHNGLYWVKRRKGSGRLVVNKVKETTVGIVLSGCIRESEEIGEWKVEKPVRRGRREGIAL